MPLKKGPRVGLIYASAKSSWASCRSISSNLSAAYSLLENKCEQTWIAVSNDAIHIDDRCGSRYLLDLAEKIHAHNFDQLIFIDHNVNIFPLLIALKAVNKNKLLGTPLVFHIYGDFTLFAETWVRIGKLLLGHRVKFVCASSRQTQMVRFFEAAKDSSCAITSPFPVDVKKYQFSQRLRDLTRTSLSIPDDGVFLFYAGRISLQKGVYRLVEEVLRLLKEGKGKIYLGLAGPFDDIGAPTIGITLPDGYIYHKFQGLLSSLSEEKKKRIIFLGSLDVEDLRAMYCAADLFVSLSLYHDEDFGMAPAEALACGLPTILTDWGGYSSFGVEGTRVRYIPVEINQRGVSMSLPALSKELRDGVLSVSGSADRLLAGKAFANSFSVRSVSETLEDVVFTAPFQFFAGFDWRLNSLTKMDLKETFYSELYKNYVGTHA